MLGDARERRPHELAGVHRPRAELRLKVVDGEVVVPVHAVHRRTPCARRWADGAAARCRRRGRAPPIRRTDEQRGVLGVQVDVSDRHGEHDHPREPFDRARSAGDLTSAWMRWSDAGAACSSYLCVRAMPSAWHTSSWCTRPVGAGMRSVLLVEDHRWGVGDLGREDVRRCFMPPGLRGVRIVLGRRVVGPGPDRRAVVG